MDPKQPQKPQQRDSRQHRRPQPARTGRYSGVHPSASRPQHTAGPRPQNTQGARPHHGGGRPHSGGSAQKKARTKTFQYSEMKAMRTKFTPSPQHDSEDKKAFKKNRVAVPEVEAGIIRIVPIGGVEQVGQNMTAIEYGDDILIVDAGFQFSTEDTPGVDYIIPNTAYLEERKHKIRGLFITHGHLDHIGAIPYLIEKIGNPPIYTREFGAVMIAKRQEEFPHVPKLDIKIVSEGEVISIGKDLKVHTFSISHTIPDSMGLIIKTPFGDIVFIEDVRVDNDYGKVTQEEEEQYKRFADKEVLLLTMDSTSIEKPGFSLSEMTVVKNIEKIVREVNGRLIIATFASQVERIVAILNIAEQLGKKVVIEGRSMKTNVEIAKQLGLVTTKNFITMEEMANFPPNKVVMIVTGAQGEEFAALNRIANKTHRYIKLEDSDTILMSSSIIPVNINDIVKLKDNLYRSGAKIITYLDSDVHASGHGNRDELKWIQQHIKHRFFMPVHGNHYMLKQHAEMSHTLGTPRENIVVPDNGSIVEIYEEGTKIRIRKEKAASEMVTVDGFSIGDTQEYVIRDRQMLAQDGMFVVVATVDQEKGLLKKSPDLISRGFIYLKENQELLRAARHIIKKTVEDGMRGKPANFDVIKAELGDNISKFLFQKTGKRPLVIPVVLSV